ncbi:MAG: ATP synthase gamma chain [Parcubacteria group bacterium GW2011_GWB1_55_9]|nr:MAG: ATP synthase gamma chain [Parcubacteria group bacterium GW2011_GWB1_55_9]
MALKDIKNKIKATQRTHKVTRAMEAVSAVKMRTTQSTALAGRPYARAALSILARLSGRAERCALVILTSDKGLAGALNSGVIKAAAEAVAAYPVAAVTVYAYGKKGEEYFARRGYRIARAFENKQDVVEFSVMEELAAELSQEFMKETYDEVLVAYSNFKSTFEQVPAVRRLLPLTLANIEQLVRDIVPVKGKWSELGPIESPAAYSIEPDGKEVLNYLIPRLVSVSLYHFLLEAKASEHSARMVAMKNASDKSREVAHDLTRLFNKIRQAGITREVSEIVGGREALTT